MVIMMMMTTTITTMMMMMMMTHIGAVLDVLQSVHAPQTVSNVATMQCMSDSCAARHFGPSVRRDSSAFNFYEVVLPDVGAL